ncbi:MAG: hypothetical protein ACH350_10605 [Parachlamydiaceae bacterium]
MINFLDKYELNYENALEYVKNDLDDVNVLSKELLKLLNFKNGYFFTMLPSRAKFKEIYNFKVGGILPQNPIKEYYVDGIKSNYSVKNSINNELSFLILNEMKKNFDLSFVVDKVTGTANNVYYYTFSDCNPLFYNEEVYFLLNKVNASAEVICKCLQASTSFWHSLSIFTMADLVNVKKTFTLEQIKEICVKTELIMVGAYDGEGYVFWEKNKANSGRNFFN